MGQYIIKVASILLLNLISHHNQVKLNILGSSPYPNDSQGNHDNQETNFKEISLDVNLSVNSDYFLPLNQHSVNQMPPKTLNYLDPSRQFSILPWSFKTTNLTGQSKRFKVRSEDSIKFQVSSSNSSDSVEDSGSRNSKRHGDDPETVSQRDSRRLPESAESRTNLVSGAKKKKPKGSVVAKKTIRKSALDQLRCRDMRHRIDAVLWPTINQTQVWIFKGKDMYLFDLSRKTLSNHIKIAEMFDGFPRVENVSGVTSSKIFESSNGTKFFYTYLVVSNTFYIYKHVLGRKNDLAGGQFLDSLIMPCMVNGPPRCFTMMKGGSHANRYYFIMYPQGNQKRLGKPYWVECASGLDETGVLNRNLLKSQKCQFRATLDRMPWDVIEKHVNPCKIIDIPWIKVPADDFDTIVDFYFVADHHKVLYKFNNIQRVLPVHEVFGCPLPYKKEFNYYKSGLVFLILTIAITGVIMGIALWDVVSNWQLYWRTIAKGGSKSRRGRSSSGFSLSKSGSLLDATKSSEVPPKAEVPPKPETPGKKTNPAAGRK